MNVSLTQQEFDALPSRDELTDDPLPKQYYRARAHPTLVFMPQHNDWGVFMGWYAHRVDIAD